mgnify:CR=1 FL=1
MHAKKDNTVSFCQDERFLAVKVVASAVKKEDILFFAGRDKRNT